MMEYYSAIKIFSLIFNDTIWVNSISVALNLKIIKTPYMLLSQFYVHKFVQEKQHQKKVKIISSRY